MRTPYLSTFTFVLSLGRPFPHLLHRRRLLPLHSLLPTTTSPPSPPQVEFQMSRGSRELERSFTIRCHCLYHASPSSSPATHSHLTVLLFTGDLGWKKGDRASAANRKERSEPPPLFLLCSSPSPLFLHLHHITVRFTVPAAGNCISNFHFTSSPNPAAPLTFP